MESANFLGAAPRGLSPRLALSVLLGAALLAGCSSNNDTTTPPAASAIGVISGNAQTATVAAPGLSQPFVVKVTDQNGNAISGVTVSFTASGGASLTSGSATTNASGNATDSLTLVGTTAGTDTVLASVSGVTTNATFTYTAQAGAAANIAIVSGNNQSGTISTAIAAPMVVQVKDQFGNDVANATVNWTVTAGTIVGNAQSVSDNSGMAQAGLELPALAGVVTVTATIQGTQASAMFTETAM